MTSIWSPEAKIVMERQLWIAVMRAQSELGLPVPAEAIADYGLVTDKVDLDSIAARERVTKHDVKARIEEFNELAGHELIHLGMTSRDLTENVEQLQVLKSLLLVRDKTVAALQRLASLALAYSDTAITGRSHNVPAQTTTLGKRFASAADETLVAFARLEDLLARYGIRYLLLEKGGRSVHGTLLEERARRSRSWMRLYEDERSVLFERAGKR